MGDVRRDNVGRNHRGPETKPNIRLVTILDELEIHKCKQLCWTGAKIIGAFSNAGNSGDFIAIAIQSAQVHAQFEFGTRFAG
jgi:hypothetical protein